MFKNPLRALNLAVYLAGVSFLIFPHIAYAGWSCNTLKYLDSPNQTFVFDNYNLLAFVGFVGIILAILWVGKAFNLKKSAKDKAHLSLANINLVISLLFTLILVFWLILGIQFFQAIAQLLYRALVKPSWVERDYTFFCKVTNYSLNLGGRILLATIVFGAISIVIILAVKQFSKLKKA